MAKLFLRDEKGKLMASKSEHYETKGQDLDAKRATRKALQMAKLKTPMAMRTLLVLMADDAVPAKERIHAAEVVLDRGLGKAAITTINIDAGTDDDNRQMASSLARDVLRQMTTDGGDDDAA